MLPNKVSDCLTVDYRFVFRGLFVFARRSRMKAKNLTDFLFFLILGCFILFLVIPLIFGVFISLTNWTGVTRNYQFVGIDNYLKMFRDTRTRYAFKITFKYLLCLLPPSLVIGYVNANLLNRLRKGRRFMAFISFFPYVMTPVAVCIIWNQIYYRLITSLGELFNIELLKTNLLANADFALYAVALVDLWILIPYATLMFYSALSVLSSNQISAAKLDGANSFYIFLYIKLPYLMPTIGTISTIMISYALTHIDTIMALTSGGPGRATETIYFVVYQNSMADKRYGYGSAEGIVLSIAAIAVYLIISKLTNRKTNRLGIGD